MIRADLASRIPPAVDLAPRPALPAAELGGKLAGLAVGQRVLAQIEALLPNGTYRAQINQRNVTLALPFAAKTGEAIELEVTESDGKLTLAVLSQPGGSKPASSDGAATATLSRAGQLIGQLLGSRAAGGSELAATPLNGNLPLASAPPATGQDMLPLLARAIVESGMFYESHQAEWIAGRYGKEQLLNEPQGKLAPASASSSSPARATDVAASGAATTVGAQPGGQPAALADEMASSSASSARSALTAGQAQGTGVASAWQPVAAPLQALVQQQLEALATQNFAWQGQVWPGQQMEWQIEAPDRRSQEASGPSEEHWQTRLHLALPRLGEIDARLLVSGQRISLALRADSEATRSLLREQAAELREQFQRVGLDISALGVNATDPSPAATIWPDPVPPVDNERPASSA